MNACMLNPRRVMKPARANAVGRFCGVDHKRDWRDIDAALNAVSGVSLTGARHVHL